MILFFSLLILLISLIIHEFSHAYAALLFGDDTAKKLGRLTLNPFRHLDVVGSVLLPLSMYLFQSPYLFGWAKPVPVNFSALSPYRKGVLWVAFSGPLSNFILAILALFVIVFFQLSAGLFFSFFLLVFYLNIILFVFNLLPFPPLDGFKIFSLFLPQSWTSFLLKYEKWGLILFFIAFYFSFLDWIFYIPAFIYSYFGDLFSMQF